MNKKKKRDSHAAARRAGEPSLLGTQTWRIEPKLRMIANGSSRVNALRAVRSACVSVTKRAPEISPSRVTGRADVPISPQQLKSRERRGSQRRLPSDILVNVFIDTTGAQRDDARLFAAARHVHRKGNLITATVPLSELARFAGDKDISHVELGEPVAAPRPLVSDQRPTAPGKDRWTFGDEALHKWGKGILIGIVDVNGFDFSHQEFLDANRRTRFVSIWDQGGEGRESPAKRGTASFDYGAEFIAADLNRAITASRRLKLPAYEIERQSELVVGSHGTHVASIAAGNHGICRKADIAAVLLSIPSEEIDRRKSFYDSTRLVHAVEYLLEVAAKRKQPISINISLGTNGHAHDGSAAACRWIDSALSVPGRCVTVAAGNAGQEAAQFEGDRGYVMGRIHTSGEVPARELTKDIEWIVAGNGIADVSENELGIWYGPQDRLTVSLLPPGLPDAHRWIGPIRPGEYIENFVVPEEMPDNVGGSVVSIYNELYHPTNGCNCISVLMTPFYTESGPVGIPAGTWTVRLQGEEVRDGRYHGWIERDDPRPAGRANEQEIWNFPSFFSENSNVDNSSVSSLACGRWTLAVANLDEKRGCINITSSQGPTRDNRCKPEVAAPGTDIVAAKGFAGPDDLWIEMTGTSMASPYMAGVAGLMLAANNDLTAAQIAGIVQRTSRPLPGGRFAWANDAGFGTLDPEACIREARSAMKPVNLNPANPVRKRRKASKRT